MKWRMKKLLRQMLMWWMILLCSPPRAKTQEHSLWHDLGLYGGQFQTIAVDPFDRSRLFAGSYLGGGLFRSTDYGNSWHTIPGFKDTEVFEITFDPLHQGTLWVAHNQYISASRDYGGTWQVFTFAEQHSRFCYTVVVDPHDPTGNTVYAGTGGPDGTDENGAVFKTITGGRHWFKTGLFAANDVLKLAVHPRHRGELWAISSIMLGIPEGNIYATANGGVSWRCWDIGWYLDEVVIHPRAPHTVYVAGEGGILRTQDGLKRTTVWEQLAPTTRCRSLAIFPQDPDTLLAGLDQATALSADRGTTWQYYPSPNRFLSLAVDPTDQSVIYGGDANQGVFRSTDGAQSWNEINAGVQANQIYTIDYSPTDARVILAGTLGGIYLRDASGRWQRINDRHSEAVAFHAQQEAILYAGFYQQFGKSIDRGATWSYRSVSAAAEAHDVACLAVSPLDPELLLAGLYFYSGARGELLKSTDGGNSFDVVWSAPVPVNATAIHPADAHILFAGTGSFYAPVTPGGLFMSSDGGRHWTATTLQNVVVNSIAISTTDPQRMFAGCGGSDCTYAGIYRSTDGGATWEAAARGMPAEYAVTALAIDATDDQRIYAASFYGGMYLSLDGGNYWTQCGLSDFLVYDVKQAGQTLTKVFAGVSQAVAAEHPAASVAAGTTGGIYQYAASGTGVLTGMVTAQTAGVPVDGADIYAPACGTSARSVNGYYLLLLPAGVHTIEIRAAGYETAVIPNLLIAAGQSLTRDVVLTPAAAAPCVAAWLLADERLQHHLGAVRAFRDEVLRRSDLGRTLIARYNATGDALLSVLAAHPNLKARAQKLLVSLVPLIDAVRSGCPVTIPDHLWQEGLRFCDALERAAPAHLKPQFRDVRQELDRRAISKLLKSG